MTTRSLAEGADRRSVPWIAVAAVAAVVALVALVVVARYVWELPAVASFVARYPGVAPAPASVGTPGWVVALHALNLFFLVQIVASGWAVRTAQRPIGHWTPRRRRPGAAGSITLEQWFHVALDLTWLTAGVVYVVALFVSGRWVRLVPTSWEIVPNAASVALQYLSLHPAPQDSWVAYNALQQLTYCGVVFVLAPVAAFTGWRLSSLWPAWAGADRWLPKEPVRRVHFAAMVCFVAFVVVHVSLVVIDGPVQLLNHMFAGRDDDSLVGVLVLAAVVAVSAGAVAAARPIVLRTVAGFTGKVTR